ncbi:hypothetical protein BST46_16810, partial [Mycobacterium timonense]
NEIPNLPQHTLKIGIVDASDSDEFGFDHYRRALARKLHLLEPLRYQPVDIPRRLHRAMWLENCDIDLDYHVRRLQIRAPGGRRELDAAIGEIASTALDRSKPLWEFHFVEGMADNRFAIIGKVHHALADGVASANLIARALDFPDASWPDRDDYPRDPRRRVISAVGLRRTRFPGLRHRGRRARPGCWRPSDRVRSSPR